MKKNRTLHATTIKRAFKISVVLYFLVSTIVLSHLGYASGVTGGDGTWRVTDAAFLERFLVPADDFGAIIASYAFGGFLSLVGTWILSGVVIGIDQARFSTLGGWKERRNIQGWDT